MPDERRPINSFCLVARGVGIKPYSPRQDTEGEREGMYSLEQLHMLKAGFKHYGIQCPKKLLDDIRILNMRQTLGLLRFAVRHNQGIQLHGVWLTPREVVALLMLFQVTGDFEGTIDCFTIQQPNS